MGKEWEFNNNLGQFFMLINRSKALMLAVNVCGKKSLKSKTKEKLSISTCICMLLLFY